MIAASQFLQTLFGHPSIAKLWLPIWCLQTKETQWFQCGDLARAEAAIKSYGADQDLYFGVCPQITRGHEKSRGCAVNAGAIVCMWADVDYGKDGHGEGKSYPATEWNALALLTRARTKPSLVIHSGHGLQAYWMLEAPWLLPDDAERDRARKSLDWWHQDLVRIAKPYDIDKVCDLARVLRIPGTYNNKISTSPKEVRIINVDSERDQVRA